MNLLRGLRAAFAYFTILPVGSAGPADASALGWLPLVGALLGAIAGACGLGVALVAPHALAVATAFAASIVLTGALHVDGFLDSCDALFASVSPARRLEILDDPRHGTFAIAGFAAAGAVWLGALWSLPPQALPLALAFAAVTSRTCALVAARGVAYARPGTRTPAFARPVPIALVLLDGAVAIGCAFALASLRGIAIVAVCAVLAAACVAWIRPRLGGFTGDAYGFTIVVTEVAALAAAAGALGSSPGVLQR